MADGGSGGTRPGAAHDGVLLGGLSLVRLVRAGSTCEAVLEPRGAGAPVLSERERAVLAMLVSGRCQKEIGLDLGLSVSTVSSHVCGALRKLGFLRWEHAVVVAAMLDAGEERATTGASGALVLAVDVSRALGRLSEAERDVVLLVLDGRSNAEIARERGRSSRTVANQLASAFRKHGVGGRLALIRRLMMGSSCGPREERAPRAQGRSFDSAGSVTMN